MSELDDFLTPTLARQVTADEALHNGDPTPRLALWSTNDPVTVLGAMRSASGWTRSASSSAGSGQGSPTALVSLRAHRRGRQRRPGLHGRL
jgi:hypothetical protein